MGIRACLGCRQGHQGLCQLGLQLVKDRGAQALWAGSDHACHLPAARVSLLPHLVNHCTEGASCMMLPRMTLTASQLSLIGWQDMVL